MSQWVVVADEDSRDSGIADMGSSVVDPEMPRTSGDEFDDVFLSSSSKTSAIVFRSGQRRPLSNISNSSGYRESPKSRRLEVLKNNSSPLGSLRSSSAQCLHSSRNRLFSHQPEEKRSQGRNSECPRVYSTSILERHPYDDDHHLVPEPKVHYHLPTLNPEDTHAFRRIAVETLVHLLHSLTVDEFNAKYIVVDCRYPYEYDGGHVKNAINLYNPAECSSIFFPDGQLISRIPIFYCEYSSVRGPAMANRLRELDRRRNDLQYPRLDYQEIYVLDKGYRAFSGVNGCCVTKNLELCTPSGYVPMHDPKFADDLRKYHHHKSSRTRRQRPCRLPHRFGRSGQESPTELQSGRSRGPLFTPPPTDVISTLSFSPSPLPPDSPTSS